MDKSTGTPPSLEEKKALPNCGNKDGNIIHVLTNCISTSVATVLKCMKWLYPYVTHMSLVFGDEFLAVFLVNCSFNCACQIMSPLHFSVCFTICLSAPSIRAEIAAGEFEISLLLLDIIILQTRVASLPYFSQSFKKLLNARSILPIRMLYLAVHLN